MISPSLLLDEEDLVAELVPEEKIRRFKAKEMAKRSSHYDMIMVSGKEHQGTGHHEGIGWKAQQKPMSS
ncbi:unnamed protein product [Cochlearia groenlandica]